MVKTSVKSILQKIESLGDREKLELELKLAQRSDKEWRKEVAAARKIARKRKIDDTAIERAIERVRYGR